MRTEIWKSINGFVDIAKYPKLPCPYCSSETLSLDQRSFQTKPLPEKYKEMASRHYEDQQKLQEARIAERGDLVVSAFDDHPLWGLIVGVCAIGAELAERIHSIYQCISFFECEQCQGAVSAVGFSKIHQRRSDSEVQQSPQVKFEYFTPTIPMMDVSPNVPVGIRSELLDSFKHYHFDPPSSASKLRRAIEQFCHDMGAEGKNLQRKINSLKDTNPEEAKYLEALKLVGNEGTHSDGVDEQDLLLAFKVFQYVLELYDRRARFIATMPDYQKITAKFSNEISQIEHVKKEGELS